METRFSDKTGIYVYALKVYNITTKRNEICWSHFDSNNTDTGNSTFGARVGPWYKSKTELLADHESYLRRAGWLND